MVIIEPQAEGKFSIKCDSCKFDGFVFNGQLGQKLLEKDEFKHLSG